MFQALPVKRYEYGDWRKAKVNIDYHIEAERSYYSVSPSHGPGQGTFFFCSEDAYFNEILRSYPFPFLSLRHLLRRE